MHDPDSRCHPARHRIDLSHFSGTDAVQLIAFCRGLRMKSYPEAAARVRDELVRILADASVAPAEVVRTGDSDAEGED